MAKTLTMKFINVRKVPFAEAAADLAIVKVIDGVETPIFQINGFFLKKSATKGYYYQAPSEIRKRNGEVVMENGYPKRDDIFSLYSEDGAGKDGGRGITAASWEARKALIAQFVEAAKVLGEDDGRGAERAPARAPARQQAAAAAPARAAKAATAPTAVDEDEVGSPTSDDDDPFPF